MNEPLRILISAHEVSPRLGSECSTGWQLTTRLGAFHDVTVLFAATNQFRTNNYQEHIEEYYRSTKAPRNVRFIPISQPWGARAIARLNQLVSPRRTSIGVPALYFLAYRLWQRSAFRHARELADQDRFDVVHHLNALSFREPSFLWCLGLPFVWGPMSGLSMVPWSFIRRMPVRTMVHAMVRNGLNRLQFSLSPRIRRATDRAAWIYAVTRDDVAFLQGRSARASQMLDIGAAAPNPSGRRKRPIQGQRVKLIWVGRLDHFKALDLLLRAYASSPAMRAGVTLTVVGDGPQGEHFRVLASELGLPEIVWIGAVEKTQVDRLMQEADVLVHTSIKEAASAVILEGLSSGLAVVCHDAFGMHYSIDAQSGIKVPFVSPAASIEGFRAAIEQLVADRGQLAALQAGALRRSQNLSWDAMVTELSECYAAVADCPEPNRP